MTAVLSETTLEMSSRLDELDDEAPAGRVVDRVDDADARSDSPKMTGRLTRPASSSTPSSERLHRLSRSA